ncbi:MAG: hypothetical protein Q4D42_13050, partial [Eubacteriales bacterium]|nr:hypothetical protein [Eubacteriales bacterium]
AQQQFHFTYIRLSGILDSNVLIFHQDQRGKLICNFVYLDMILDFCLSLNLSPFVEFSFMPKAFAKHPDVSLLHSSYISGAKNYTLWAQLIRLVINHLIERYGINTLLSWKFSPMRSTYIGVDSLIEPEDYLTMYGILYDVVKREQGLYLCGLGTDLDLVFQSNCAFLKQFISYCSENHCFPDCITIQSYNCIYNVLNSSISINRFLNQTAEPFPLSDDPCYMKNRLAKFIRILSQLNVPELPIVLEDWGFTQWQRDPRNDTAYKATFLIKNVLDNHQQFDFMATLKLSDLMEETSTKLQLFHGGPGLMTVNGIPKSPYYAMLFLSKMGNHILLQDDGIFITRSGNNLQILLYYYCHSNHTANHNYQLSDDPYASFVTGPSRQFNLEISGIPPHKYREEFRSISPASGSSYDTWIRMGSPNTLTEWQTEYLQQRSLPDYKVCVETIHDTFHFTTTLIPHEVQLILLEPI